MTQPTPRPAARGPRGEYAKSKAKRVAILDAALEVFAQSGYRSGSLREVAARVDMSEPGLLHHFPSKVMLLEAVLDRRDDLNRDMVEVDDPDGAVTLRGLVALAAHNATIPGVVELFCTLSAEATSPDHPAHDYFVNRYEYTRGMVRNALGRLRADGRVDPSVDLDVAAAAAIALWDGVQLQWLMDRSSVDMAGHLRVYFSSFVTIEWDPEPPEAEAPRAHEKDRTT